jgi:hypothetical protein
LLQQRSRKVCFHRLWPAFNFSWAFWSKNVDLLQRNCGLCPSWDVGVPREVKILIYRSILQRFIRSLANFKWYLKRYRYITKIPFQYIFRYFKKYCDCLNKGYTYLIIFSLWVYIVEWILLESSKISSIKFNRLSERVLSI